LEDGANMKIDAEQLNRAVAAYCKDTGRQFSAAEDGKYGYSTEPGRG